LFDFAAPTVLYCIDSDIIFFHFFLVSDPNKVLSLLAPAAKASPLADVDAIELLDRASAENINRRDETTGWAPLHVAARHGSKDRIVQILQQGGNIMAEDREQQALPMQLAIANCNSKYL
jgi:ankyrin repeat protein